MIRLASPELFEVLRLLLEPHPRGFVRARDVQNLLRDIDIYVSTLEMRLALHALGGRPQRRRIPGCDFQRRPRYFWGLRMKNGAGLKLHRAWSNVVTRELASCLPRSP